MSDQALGERVLATLAGRADAEQWSLLLHEAVSFETLGRRLTRRQAVAERLEGSRFGHLIWTRLESSKLLLSGDPIAGSKDRGMVIMIEHRDGLIRRLTQQNKAVPKQPATAMKMAPSLRERFDAALANKHAMSITYVDEQGRPHLSLRGSIRTFDDDKLSLWARSADGGLAAAVRTNPAVALLFRDEESRATYQLSGRARVAEDEATRKSVFSAIPAIEQQHDFAMLGAAIIIDLDLVEGYAGLSPMGQVDPVRLVRNATGRE